MKDVRYLSEEIVVNGRLIVLIYTTFSLAYDKDCDG